MMTRALDFLNRRSKGWACRLVQLTGKARIPIHPKHLIDRGAADAWFLDRLPEGGRVLDLGAGHGLHGVRAEVRRGCRATWVDKVAPPAEWPGWVVADLEDPLPFRDRSFDAVLMLDVLEHLANRDQALKEVQRILKPGGRLFLAVPNASTQWRQRLRAAGLFAFSDPDHKREYRSVDIAIELGEAGLLIESLAPVPALDTPWAGLIDLVGGLHLPTYRRLVAWKRRRALEDPQESTGFLVVARA